MRRKPNAEQRRRDLCDGAIELLAEDGARGVTHLERLRARARFELLMVAAHGHELSAVFENPMDQFVTISEEAVGELKPADVPFHRENKC